MKSLLINLVTNIRERATREIKNNPAKKNNINLILASVIEIMNQNLRSDIPVTDLIDLTNSILFNDYEEDKNTINNFLHPEVKTL